MFHVKHGLFFMLFPLPHVLPWRRYHGAMNGKQIMATIGIAAALAAGGAAAGYATTDIPEADDVAVEQGVAPQVTIDDPDDVLSDEDEKRMIKDAERF